ncbi:MAG: GGDEF domain-containing protein [Lachnospiraceae bacterium]|nr:GGDEF domain-containing protein [Lachnospiraceae bacterium]
MRKKVILFIILMALAFSATALIASRTAIDNMVNDDYITRATEIAKTVSSSLNSEDVASLKKEVMNIYNSIDESNRYNSNNWGTPEFDEYISNFDPIYDLPEFQSIMAEMKEMQNQIDVDCLYLNYLDKESRASIYLLDAAEEDACPPGCFDQFEAMNSKETEEAFEHPEVGYPALISNTDVYGWLIYVAVPVFDKDKNVICYSCVDISMNQIRARQRNFMFIMAALMFALAVLVCLLGFIIVNRFVVKPINQLSYTAVNYTKEGDSAVHHGFSDLNISLHDEIGVLADSMKQMETDMNNYYTTVIAAKKEVSRMGEIANRDALTGVRNKRSYDEMIADIDKEIRAGETNVGVAMVDLNYLKLINDEHGHDKGNIALKKLCQLICKTFAHSPVFRIGGDEFAIILKNSDFDNITSLEDEFNTKISSISSDGSLPPWEKISAALGYSVFRPGVDKNMADVFKRADDIMYEHKRKMKQGYAR